MAKQRGIQTRVLINQYDLSNYFKSFSGDTNVAALDATAFQDTAKAYLVDGYNDGKISLEGFYARDNTTLDQIDNILRAAMGGTTKQLLTVCPINSNAVGNFCLMSKADLDSLKVSSPATGLIMENADFISSSGLDAGVVLAVLAALTATANGTAVDNTAATTNGGSAHLHITAKSGTSPTIAAKVQHSTDNSTWVDLVTFTAATGLTSERVDVAAGTTVRRYLRAQYTIGGTSPSFTVAIAFARH